MGGEFSPNQASEVRLLRASDALAPQLPVNLESGGNKIETVAAVVDIRNLVFEKSSPVTTVALRLNSFTLRSFLHREEVIGTQVKQT
jgi:hypothetical protein